MTAAKVPLLDVNVIVSLAWPNHIHHRAARRWFDANADAGWATSPMTETGFVRVSSNHAVFPDAASPRTAIGILDRLCALGNHRFWHDEARFVAPTIGLDRLATSRQVTDAHLLLVAAAHGGRLATFDRGVAELLAPDDRDLVEFIEQR